MHSHTPSTGRVPYEIAQSPGPRAFTSAADCAVGGLRPVSGLAAVPAMTGRARVITPQREISRFWYLDVIAKAELAGVSPGQPGLAPEDAGGVAVDLGEEVLDSLRWRE